MPVVTVWDRNGHKGPHCPFTGAITDQFLCILQETLCASNHNFLLYLWTYICSGLYNGFHGCHLLKFSLKIYGKTIPLLVKKKKYDIYWRFHSILKFWLKAVGEVKGFYITL